MALITWTADLNTDIEIIDDQHKRIVHFINELHDTQESGNRKRVEAVIDELVEYTISHFSFEESLMEKAHYAYLEPHKKVHALFIDKINSFVERNAKGEDVAPELLRLLQRWLINHIKSEDADYSPVVRRDIERRDKEEHAGWLSRSLQKFFG